MLTLYKYLLYILIFIHFTFYYDNRKQNFSSNEMLNQHNFIYLFIIGLYKILRLPVRLFQNPKTATDFMDAILFK